MINRRVGTFLALILAVTGPAGAQVAGGSTQTQLYLNNALVAGPCTGSGTSLISTSCTIPGAYDATVTVTSKYVGPSAFDPLNPSAYQLAELGTRARIETSIFSSAGPVPLSQAPSVLAHAVAGYSDFLRLGSIRPSSIVLSFTLSGALLTSPAPDTSIEARFRSSFEVQSGHQDSDGTFGSFVPYAYGTAISTTILRQGQAAATTDQFVQSGVPGAFSYSASNSGLNQSQVTITLGPQFLDNPANDLILLKVDAISMVSSPAFMFASTPFGSVDPSVTDSDFAHTLRMTGVNAFDSNGADVTASTIVGFASLQAVPEPHESLMLLAGLAIVGAVVRRRRA